MAPVPINLTTLLLLTMDAVINIVINKTHDFLRLLDIVTMFVQCIIYYYFHLFIKKKKKKKKKRFYNAF